VATWLVHLTLYQAVPVGALPGDIVLFSWARHFTLTMPHFTQVCKWVPANLTLGVTLRLTSNQSRGSRNTPSCFLPQKLEAHAGLMGQLARIQTLLTLPPPLQLVLYKFCFMKD